MSLSLAGSVPSIRMAFGQIVQFVVTVNSSGSLSSPSVQTITVYPALWIASPQNLASQPMTGGYEVSFPLIDATTVDMVFQDAAAYQNLAIELTRNSSTQFVLSFTFLAGRDSSAVSPSYINPTNLLDGKGVDFPSVYDGAKFTVLHIYSDSDYLRVDQPVQGEALRQFNDDQFTWVLKNASGATVSTATCLQDLTVEFTAKYVGYANNYQVIIHKRPPGGTDFLDQSIQDNLSLEGVNTLTGTLPELTSPNLSAATLTNDGSSTPPTYTGLVTIDGNYFLDPSVVWVIITLVDLTGRPRSYQIEFTSFCKPIPAPAVETSLVLDSVSYNTNCVFEVDTGTRVQVNAFIDPALYEAELQAEGLSGNYAENIREIRVYILNYIPLENEDIFEPYEIATQAPLLLGNAAYNHIVGSPMTQSAPITSLIYTEIVLFEYVFQDHSLRIPFVFMLTDKSELASVFTDASNNAINQFCYDYAGGIRLHASSLELNGYSAYTDYNFYENGVPVDIVSSVVFADVGGMDLLLNPDTLDPGACYDMVLSTSPGDEPVVFDGPFPADISQGYGYVNPNYGLGFFFLLQKTAAASPSGECFWIITVRRGDEIVTRTWDRGLILNSSLAVVSVFKAETQALNTFTYTIYIFTSYGDTYFIEDSLSTNNEPGTAGASQTKSITVNLL